ncbi:hypothetical protein ACFIJ5_18170 (plasmid) [Haloimpatiens sp. FM7330]|uniref:hypothetical protein n=1 Tax=Haloimpatiens sp. FM7330 TaxID=3298610 RepID=UPI003634E331
MLIVNIISILLDIFLCVMSIYSFAMSYFFFSGKSSKLVKRKYKKYNDDIIKNMSSRIRKGVTYIIYGVLWGLWCISEILYTLNDQGIFVKSSVIEIILIVTIIFDGILDSKYGKKS